MMFVFCAWNDKNPSVELDIYGEQYIRLIDTCFKNCRYFTLNESRQGTRFDLPEKELDNWPARQYPPLGKTHLYLCSDKTKEYLLSRVDSLFSWITWGTNIDEQNGGLIPEDLCFFRSDGSVFLWSETHEGVCVLCPKPDEDVSIVISSEGWCANIANNLYEIPTGLEEYNIFLR